MATQPLLLQIAVTGKDAIPAAMVEASAAVQAGSKMIQTSFAQISSASMAAQVSMNTFGLSGTIAGKVITPAMDEAAAAAKRAAIATAAAAAEAQAAGAKIAYSMMEARHSAMAFGEIAGVHIPRMVSMMLSHMQSVGPVLAAAFPVLGAVMLLEFLAEKIPAALGKLGGMITGWSEKAKADYDSLIQENQKFLTALNDLAKEQEKIGLIGQTGVTAAQRRFANVQEDIQRASGEIPRLEARKNALQKEVDETHIFRSDAELKKVTEELAKAREALDAKIIEVDKLKNVESPTAGTELTVAVNEKNQKIAEARVEAEKTASMATLDLREKEYKTAYDLGQISAAQEVINLQILENEKYEVIKKNLASRQNLLAVRKVQGDETGGDEAKLHAEQKASAAAHQAALTEIVGHAAVERKKLEDESAKAAITGDQATGEAQVALAEARAHREYDAHRISVEQETAQLIQAEKDRKDIVARSINERIALASKEPEKNRAEISTLNSELEKLAVEHEGRLEAIAAAGVAKRNDLTKAELEQTAAEAERIASIQLGTASRINEDRLKYGRESSKQWLANEEASINQWYNVQRDALQKYLAFALATYGAENQAYRSAKIKMEELDAEANSKIRAAQQKQDQEFKSLMKGMEQAANHEAVAVLSGQQTLGKGIASVLQNEMGQLTAYLLKKAELWAAHWIMLHVLHIGAKTQETTTEAAGDAAKAALASATNVSMATSDAGLAAAAAFTSAMESVPFPANMVAAPAAAATALAQMAPLVAMASAERGMVVPDSPTFAMLHKNEMVLPAHLSNAVQRMAGNGGEGGGGNQTIHFAPHVTAMDERGAKRALRSQARDFGQMMKNLSRRGFLPSA